MSTSLKELLERGNLISPEELAPALRVAKVTVYAWAKKGKIPHLRIERCVRFTPEQIQTWLESKGVQV